MRLWNNHYTVDSYQLMSDCREHWLLQYILTRFDFVHHKTSQRESHKHLQFQYNYSTFHLCILETKLHQRLPVEKHIFYVIWLNMHIVSDFLNYIFSCLKIPKEKKNCLQYMNIGLTHTEVLRNTVFDCIAPT